MPHEIIQPGAKIGMLGGGQLGRMFALAARRMGYRIFTLDPHPESPAGQVCDKQVVAPYADLEGVRKLAQMSDVVTFEFENIPIEAVTAAAEFCPVRPRGEVLHICQNREREKMFLSQNGFPCADFRIVENAVELAAAVSALGGSCVMKIADFGYDGKGQLRVTKSSDYEVVWKEFGANRAIVEKWISYEKELSVIIARGLDGQMAIYPPAENRHKNHILDVTIAPGAFLPETIRYAEVLAQAIAEKLDLVGLLAVEMFLLGTGKILVNEMAPRPHNSGHYTIEAAITSQFEQHLRAICGLPLGSPKLVAPAIMFNLLGDRWKNGVPDWAAILRNPHAKLHLYGKVKAKPGRKMGHITFVDTTSVPQSIGI